MTAIDLLRSVLSIFLSSVAPPLSIAAAGYLLGRVRDVDVDGLSAVTVYILLPALVFETLVTTSIDVGTVASIAGAMVAFTFLMGVVAWATDRSRGQEGTVVYGAAMAAAIPNVGNFGIPVASFAFGEAGRSTAVLFVVVQNLVLYTLGIYFLSKGRADGGHREAIRRVFGQPVLYAVLIAMTVAGLDAAPPADGTIMQTLGMVGDASIPIFLLILGLQVEKMDVGATVRQTLPTVGLKLLVAPVVAVAVVALIDVGDLAVTWAFVVLAAGPSAVTPMVLSIEFADDPDEGVSTGDYVGTVIFLTIFGSLPIVTGLILLARSGVVA
ncbi:AEC family transporter [Halomicrobium salinisoli]|uniref:AEC family transporter n=1 Tax=Halomicrobium salinisoli TaxID=2878391 RepID=UPI001CEFB48B|nr:AEC family transporter [Halomicrobium salinisoli]